MAATRHRLPKPPPAPVHPIVEIDYRVRTWANLLVLAVIGSVFLERESPAWYWLLLAFQGVGWAPLARVRAQRATDSKRAEHQNLLADAVIYGVLSGLVSFSLWPTTLMLASILLSVLSLGGPQLAVRAAIVFVPGALLGSALNGFSLQFESSLRTSLLSVVCFVPYLLMFGMNSFVQNQRAQRARHELAQRNEQVTRQNRELELARMLAESANRTKSAFLANMSHELRTPLNAIIGYSEMLEADALDEGQHAKAQDLGKIRSAGASLLTMVEDVLNLSRLEAGQTYLASNPIRPGEMVRAVANTVREQIENNGNAFRIDCDMGTPCVMGDEGKLRQILSHLLSNAGKFTRAGEVLLRAWHEGDTQTLVLQVSDTGVGIAPALRERLFRPFSQADDSSTRRFGGSGMGLAIAQHYCDLMGGSIDVQSEPGAGACFTARIPAPLANRVLQVAAAAQSKAMAHA